MVHIKLIIQSIGWDLTDELHKLYIWWWYAKESINRASVILRRCSMPKNWDIDQDKLSGDILQSQ